MIVALYARVSTGEQNPDNQIIRLREAAEARGYLVYAEYIDVDEKAPEDHGRQARPPGPVGDQSRPYHAGS